MLKYTKIRDYQSTRIPSPFAFQDKNYIFDILFSTNFREIKIFSHIEKIDWFFGLSPQDAVEMYFRTSSAMTVDLKKLTDSTLKIVKKELLSQYKIFLKNNNISFPSAVWIVEAQKK